MSGLQELTKEYVDKRLGKPVSIDDGRLTGNVGYEHNVGKLAIYSEDNKLLEFLKAGSKIRFLEEGVEFIFPKKRIRE